MNWRGGMIGAALALAVLAAGCRPESSGTQVNAPPPPDGGQNAAAAPPTSAGGVPPPAGWKPPH